MLGALQVDHQIIALGAHVAQPAPVSDDAPFTTSQVVAEYLLESQVVGEQLITGGHGVEMQNALREGLENVLHGCSGDGHVTYAAPLDDQDLAHVQCAQIASPSAVSSGSGIDG